MRKRTIIFNAFVDKFIYSEDVEKDVHYAPEELESESFEESIPELTKIRRQKKILMINTQTLQIYLF